MFGLFASDEEKSLMTLAPGKVEDSTLLGVGRHVVEQDVKDVVVIQRTHFAGLVVVADVSVQLASFGFRAGLTLLVFAAFEKAFVSAKESGKCG